jgi:hypothetical protein
MINFSKIKITEEKLGTFGDVQLKGGIRIDAVQNITEDSSKQEIEFKKSEIRRTLHNKVYSELQNPFFYIEDVIKTYVIPNMNYSPTPWFVNEKELRENLDKIRKVLEGPK